MKSKKTAMPAIVPICCRILDDKKAADLKVLDVSAHSSITDFLIIATATSEPHLRALRVELEKSLDAENVHVVGIETAVESGWLVIDAFDVMIHLFLANTREHFGLERLWRDSVEVAPSSLLPQPPPTKPKAPRKRAPAAKRTKK